MLQRTLQSFFYWSASIRHNSGDDTESNSGKRWAGRARVSRCRQATMYMYYLQHAPANLLIRVHFLTNAATVVALLERVYLYARCPLVNPSPTTTIVIRTRGRLRSAPSLRSPSAVREFKFCFHYGCAALRVASDSERHVAICRATYRYISLTIARNAQSSSAVVEAGL